MAITIRSAKQWLSARKGQESSTTPTVDRRSVLRSALTLGAGGLALAGASSSARAFTPSIPMASLGLNPLSDSDCSDCPPMVFLSPVQYGAVGDGDTDDTQALIDTIEAAFSLVSDSGAAYDYVEPTIDLQGLTYKFTDTLNLHPPTDLLTPKARLRVMNGTLLSSVNGGSAIHIKRTTSTIGDSGDYPEITFDNVRIQKLQYGSVTGLRLEGGLRCSFVNCAFEARNIWNHGLVSTTPKQNAFAIGLSLEGAQICNFIDCHFTGNENHVVFQRSVDKTTGTDSGPSTDCRFYGCSFSESSHDAIVAEVGTDGGYPAAQCLFHGCSIETARSGSLVNFDSVKNAKFHCCRFENEAGLSDSHVSLVNGSDTRFFDCNFSGRPATFVPCVNQDSDSENTAFVGNVFPAPAESDSVIPGTQISIPTIQTPVVVGESYRAVANTNLDDQ